MRSLAHSFIHSFTCSFASCFIHAVMQAVYHALMCSLTQSFIHSFIHLLLCSIIHSVSTTQDQGHTVLWNAAREVLVGQSANHWYVICRHGATTRRSAVGDRIESVYCRGPYLLVDQHGVCRGRHRQGLKHSRQRIWRHVPKCARAWREGADRWQNAIRLRRGLRGGRPAAWRGYPVHRGRGRWVLLIRPGAKGAAWGRGNRAVVAAR